MEISSSNLDFRILLLETESLKPHEEIIDSAATSLTNSILTEGILRDPLIVDRDEHVILDGMHRFYALKKLKSRFAPCCLVDYDNPHIGLGPWFRTFTVKEPESVAEKLLTEMQLAYSKNQMRLSVTDFDEKAIIMTGNGVQFSLPGTKDPIECARNAVRLEKALIIKNSSVEYNSEVISLQRLKSSEVNLVILLPIFTKNQIREFALHGLLLPHKTTRHVMPSRPLKLDVPLPLLNDRNISQTEANRRLDELLEKRRVDRKAPGSIVDGRRYQEELLVFTA